MGNIQQTLMQKAEEVMEKAYSPYSKIKVGAALITTTGNIYTGCNVENGSYGLTICAERNAIFAAVAVEGPAMKIDSIAIASDRLTGIPPCGACRQVISEFAVRNSTKNTEVIYKDGDKLLSESISQLLPSHFELK